jgi:hypothetical protein
MAKKPARLTKRIKVSDISGYDLDGKTLAEAAKYLAELAEEYGAEAVLDWGQHDGYSESYSYEIRTTRLETDNEYETRLADEKRMKDFREQRDQAEYVRLKAIFEKGAKK